MKPLAYFLFCVFLFGPLALSLYTKISFESAIFFSAGLILAFDIILYGRLRKRIFKRRRFNKEMAGIFGAIFIILLLFSGWLYFMEDSITAFECSKETMTCVYSRATLFRPQLRTAEEYDLSGVTHTRVKNVYGGRHVRYAVLLEREDESSFKLPESFSSSWKAKNEAKKINAFLSGPKQKYLYYDASLQNDATVFLRFGSPVLVLIVCFSVLPTLLRYYKKSRPGSVNAVTGRYDENEEDDTDDDDDADENEDGNDKRS